MPPPTDAVLLLTVLLIKVRAPLTWTPPPESAVLLLITAPVSVRAAAASNKPPPAPEPLGPSTPGLFPGSPLPTGPPLPPRPPLDWLIVSAVLIRERFP